MTGLGPGLLVSGRYRLERVLARGGMGSVWAAWHTQLEVPVAVKFMDPALAANPAARERFEREARAAAQLRSPHVVQVLDYGLEDDRPYIVMEKLEGEDLRSRLRTAGRLSLAAASRILNQCCKALRLAADAGIVHRDLKPGNIFLAKTGDDEVVKILDFGVAKATTPGNIGADSTQTGALLGSPHFMSPEQARGMRNIDHRSDLWSMGVILFNVVTGRKPFRGDELGDVIVKICSDPVPRVRDFVPDLPASVDLFFQRALERNPALRFQSAREMAASFQAIVAQHLGIPESELSTGSLTVPPDMRTLIAVEETAPLTDGDAAGAPPLGTATVRTGPAPLAAPGMLPLAALPAAGLSGRGTLSSAAGSLDSALAPPTRRRWPWLGAAVALAAGAVAAGVLLSQGAVEEGSAAGSASTPELPANGGAAEIASSSEASTAGTASGDTRSATAAASATATAAPSAPTAGRTAAPRPPATPQTAHPKAPPPATTPPATPHPVLGI